MRADRLKATLLLALLAADYDAVFGPDSHSTADLTLRYVERLPHILPAAGGSIESDWPASGSTVTWRAHVKNWASEAREVGVRRALGAGSSGVKRLVPGQALPPVLLGSGVGVIVAAVLGRFLSGALYRIGPTDPASFAAGLLLLVVVAAAACLLPARRALRVDPVITLREE